VPDIARDLHSIISIVKFSILIRASLLQRPDGQALLFYAGGRQNRRRNCPHLRQGLAKYAQFASSLEKTAGFFTQLSSSRLPRSISPLPKIFWSLLKTGRSVRALESPAFSIYSAGSHGRRGFRRRIFRNQLLRAVMPRAHFWRRARSLSAGTTPSSSARRRDAHP